jgi:hypothetical protein
MLILSFRFMWPGNYTMDSYTQMRQARQDVYTTHHPPVMAWVWHQLNDILPINGNMLLFHLILFWSAIYILGLINMAVAPIWAYMGALLWIFPTILAMTGVVWKDTGVAMSLLLASMTMAYYQHHKRAPSKAQAFLIIALLLYGAATRHNAVSAIPPLAFWLVQLTYGNTKHITHKLLLAIIISISMLAGKVAFETAVASPESSATQENLLFDTIFMSKRLNKPFVPAYIYLDKGLDFETFRKTVEIGWGGYVMQAKYRTADPVKFQQLKDAYIQMVLTHPLEYLQYRNYMFWGSLNWYGKYWPYQWDVPAFDRDNQLRVLAHEYIKSSAKTIFFSTYFWFFCAIALALAAALHCVPSQVRTCVLMLSLSGITYGLGYFPVVTSADFRYYYWTMTSVIFSIALIVPAWDANRIKKKIANAK